MPNSTSVFEKINLIRDWMPLLGFGQRYVAETDIHKRALILGDLGEWLASKSSNTLDDQLVDHIVAIVKTSEGEAFVRFLVAQAEVVVSSAEANQ